MANPKSLREKLLKKYRPVHVPIDYEAYSQGFAKVLKKLTSRIELDESYIEEYIDTINLAIREDLDLLVCFIGKTKPIIRKATPDHITELDNGKLCLRYWVGKKKKQLAFYRITKLVLLDENGKVPSKYRNQFPDYA
jgi:hypothetical protein